MDPSMSVENLGMVIEVRGLASMYLGTSIGDSNIGIKVSSLPSMDLGRPDPDP